MRCGVRAAFHYRGEVVEGAGWPDLRPRLRAVCRESYCRADRFTELALLGSGECVRGQSLRPDCALYLQSGFGPLGTKSEVLQQLLARRLLPKPIQFVNSLGSSSLYYVARNLGLGGSATFVSRRGTGLIAPLALAMIDLELGVATQALVGAVEECLLPLAAHPARAEGSDWLLLGQNAAGGTSLEWRHYAQRHVLEEVLTGELRAGDRVGVGSAVAEQDRAILERAIHPSSLHPRPSAGHDSADAAQLTNFVLAGGEGALWYVAGTEQAGWTLLHLRA